MKTRPIPADPRLLLSPADSIIISLSEVKGDENMLIKGFTYRMGELLTGIKDYQIRGDILDSMKKAEDKTSTSI